jgi:rhodanese-related sulfurtransferase
MSEPNRPELDPLPEVGPDEVPETFDPAAVLDVREPMEWVAGHVEGSRHIPMSQLLARAQEIPTDRQLLVVCRSGHRSAQVAMWLNSQGVDAVNLDGGLDAWAASGRPLVDDAGRPGTVL